MRCSVGADGILIQMSNRRTYEFEAFHFEKWQVFPVYPEFQRIISKYPC